MKKEHPAQPPAERAQPAPKKDIFVASCGCLQWDDIPNAIGGRGKGPLFRIHAFEELEPEIDVMAGEIQRLSGSRATSAEEVRALASYLDQLRHMAYEVENSAVYREGTSLELCGSNSELEAMVCILRSNLDQIAMRACA